MSATKRNLRQLDVADWERIEAAEAAVMAAAGEALLSLLRSQKDDDALGFPVNVFEHSLQTATRAERAGEPDAYVVTCLFHDVADRLSPANHGAVAAELLRPYVGDDLVWMVTQHGLVQKRNFTHHPYWSSGALEPLLEPIKDHPSYEMTDRFCRIYDAPSFDPDYDSEPLEHFESLVSAIFSAPLDPRPA